jgi:hypothetical protein
MSNKVTERFKEAGYEKHVVLAVRVRRPGVVPLSPQRN